MPRSRVRASLERRVPPEFAIEENRMAAIATRDDDAARLRAAWSDLKAQRNVRQRDLSAQHAALSHQIWHVGDRDSQPAQKQLCDQHDALGTVAAALDSPALLLAGDAPAGFSFLSMALPSANLPGLAPSSRGPPALL